MDLLQAFKDFFGKEGVFAPGDKLLLAVSGGLASVVLAELCQRCGFDFVIVHCNFQLRGEESRRDEQFVGEMSRRYQRMGYVSRFETQPYAEQHKVSVQVAARELRYRWFGEFVKEGRVQWI